MKKRIFALVLGALMILSSLPAAALSDGKIILNEVFENYPTNSTAMGAVKATTGIDGRVIKEDNKNKAAYTKAWGENAKITASFTASEAKEMVFSAKIKVSGSDTSGQLLTLSGGGSTLDILSLSENGTVTLPGGKHIGGAPKNRWVTYTFLINSEKGMMDVYVNGKCRAGKFYLPSGSFPNTDTMTFSVSEPEGGFTELFVDDIRVYEGKVLPEKMSFPSVPYNNEEEAFEVTTSLDVTPTIFYENEFTENIGAISIMDGGGRVSYSPDGEGGFLKLYADAATESKTCFDISVKALAEEQKYVVSLDFRVNELTGSSNVGLFDSKNSSGNWRMGFTLNASRASDDTNGTQLFSYSQGEWHNAAFCYNTGAGSCDIYFDGELFLKGLSVRTHQTITFRVDVLSPAGGALDVDLDNIRFYRGKQPLTEEEYNAFKSGGDASGGENAVSGQTSIVDYTDEAIKSIDKSSVFMLTNDKMFANGKKITYPAGYTPYYVNGNFMVTPQVLEAAGISAKYDAASGSVDIANGKVKLTIGSDILLADGKEIKMPTKAVAENGNVYIPFRSALADGLGKHIYFDDRGFLVLSDAPFEHTNSNKVQDVFQPIDSIFKYMQFDNPRASQIIADAEKTIGNEHPRILYTSDDVNYILDRVESGDAEWKTLYKSILTSAEALLGKKINPDTPEGQESAALGNYHTDMRTLSTAYLLTGDDRFAQRAMENLVAACSFKSFGPSGLTNGTWMLGTAFGIDSFYSYLLLHEKEFEIIKEGVKKIAIDPMIDSYQGKGKLTWPTMTDNFVGYISGGAACLCLSLLSEEELRDDCAYLLENIMKSIEITITLYAPDGAWYEGVDYSFISLEHVANALTAFVNTCGTEYGLSSAKGFDRTADWFIYASTPQTGFNFHDMRAHVTRITWCGYDIAYLRGDVQSMEATKRFFALCGKSLDIPSKLRYERAITNKGIKVSLDNIPRDHYFRTADAGTFYNNLGVEEPTFVGFHGGWTGLPHDMLDLGSFMFISDGVVWGFDTGSDSYDLPNYFSLNGYRHYRKNTQGENVLTINPYDDQQNYWGQSTNAYAPLVRYETKDRGALSAYDLSEAYSRDVEKYVRGYYFGDDRNTLTVRDELTLKKQSEIYWAMHTMADIEIVDNKTAIFTKDGKKMKAEVVCSDSNYELKVMNAELLPGSPGLDAASKALSLEGVRKLVVYLPETSGELDITVKLSPQNNKYIETPIDGNTKIADWTLPDGALREPLSLSEIKVDGVEIDNFYPEKTSYTVKLPFGSERVPDITATAKNGNVTVIYAEDVTKDTVIRLEKEGYVTVEYNISFMVMADRDLNVTEAVLDVKPKAGVQGTLIKPRSASISHIQDDPIGPAKLLDDDPSTYTGGNNYCWLEVDLGEVTDISGVAISFHVGDTRSTKYDLLYSEDGTNFKRVFSGNSLGTTADYESVAAAGRVRYIRFVGYGNSKNGWVSVKEIRAYK